MDWNTFFQGDSSKDGADNKDGNFVEDSDAALLIMVNMPAEQDLFLPKIFYGDYELQMLADYSNLFNTHIHYEAMRFNNGVLDIS